MHPPQLDEAGLASARRWYVEEFAKRSLIEVELEIQSFARAGQIGVGLSGMRERLRQLGGTLVIESENEGTLVRAVLPFGTRSSRSAVQAPAEANRK